ncbi:hypothetical protein BS50DRAFT_25665 [Corynespora cassiicola Philippines]|uniref:Zn(2)-C6 fungal-type domain-containing protein n=1 Tax=Corynespora cassiicola Philippines TaxID=1448308 RepID=A0A2T2PAZ8_CORCC|nr:hypothetical protein BS50DRAFT_25665 [Corynespora cassiicola Philippines]
MSSKRPWSTDAILSSKLASFACKRCRLRKVKCDSEFPSCAGCSKAAVPCIVADYSTTRDYTRAEVHSLEQKVARLEALLAPVSDDAQHDVQSHPTSESTRFVGPECSISFIQPVVDSIRRQSSSLLASQEPAIEYHAPHHLPSRDVALAAVAE